MQKKHFAILFCSILLSSIAAFSQTDFWEQTNGPEGGDIVAIATAADGSIVAAAQRGGIYRFPQGGVSWASASWPSYDVGITSNIARSPTTGHLFVGNGCDVFRSDDNGETWNSTNFAAPGVCEPKAIAIDSHGNVFVGGAAIGAIHFSTNEGILWQTLRTDLPQGTYMTRLALDAEDNIYAGTLNDGIYKSIDHGGTWVQFGLQGISILAVGVSNQGTILASTLDPLDCSYNSIFRLTDGGNWVRGQSIYYATETFGFSPSGAIFAGITQGGGGVYRSTDDGQSWTYIGLGFTGGSVHAFAFNPERGDDVLAATANNGVHRSTDGGNNWTPFVSGLKASSVWSLLINKEGQLLAPVPSGGMYRSDDLGHTWTMPDTDVFWWGGGFESALAMLSSGTIFYAWNGIGRSHDGGNSWEENIGPEGVYFRCVAVNSQDYIYAGTTAGLLRSTDGGNNWVPLGLQAYDIRTITVTPDGHIFAGGWFSGLLRSTDEGLSWDLIDISSDKPNVFGIAVSPNGYIFVKATGVYRSKDNGSTWEKVHGLYPNAIAVNSEGRVFAAGGQQMLVSSTDYGETWSEYYGFLYQGELRALIFDSAGYMWAGSWGGGVSRSKETTFSQPSVGPIDAPKDPVLVNSSVSASAGFTDPNMLDTHTASWNWGDGTIDNGTIDETNGSGTVTGVHSYAAPGVYQIVLTVTDQHGVSGKTVFEYVVVYDPSAGFVTGSGWITSPAGAYIPDASLSGKATFGFVSKYKKGASIPTGNTQFKFHIADMTFKSTSYQWLVIAGSKAQYKGEGNINGSGLYGFLLTAIDGKVMYGGGTDRFRIKIWNKASGQIFYDNQIGADENSDASTVISGGSIVVHK